MEILNKVLNFNDHRGGGKGFISATTLLGANYKGHLNYIDAETNDRLVPIENKIGSSLGTGFGLLAEKALANEEDVLVEQYKERYILDLDVYITGTFDYLYYEDNIWHIGDFKTSMPAKFADESIDKAMKQMSIYRWLNENKFNIADEAEIGFVSRSRNKKETIPVQLMSLTDTRSFILERSRAIIDATLCDCHTLVKYNPCSYCNYVCGYRK